MVKERAREIALELNKPYRDFENARHQEFFQDARRDLGYDEFLSEAAMAVLESQAWNNGHSYGYPEVFNCLSNLVEFLESILKNNKED